jgi:hypothetical protein
MQGLDIQSLIFRCPGPEYAGLYIQSRIFHPGYIFRAESSKQDIPSWLHI